MSDRGEPGPRAARRPGDAPRPGGPRGASARHRPPIASAAPPRRRELGPATALSETTPYEVYRSDRTNLDPVSARRRPDPPSRGAATVPTFLPGPDHRTGSRADPSARK